MLTGELLLSYEPLLFQGLPHGSIVGSRGVLHLGRPVFGLYWLVPPSFCFIHYSSHVIKNEVHLVDFVLLLREEVPNFFYIIIHANPVIRVPLYLGVV